MRSDSSCFFLMDEFFKYNICSTHFVCLCIINENEARAEWMQLVTTANSYIHDMCIQPFTSA